MSSELEVFKEALRLLGNGKKVALCTIVEKVGSGPRDVGTKILVSEDGNTTSTIGGGYFERFVVDESLRAMKSGKSQKAMFSLDKKEDRGTIGTGLICGGKVTIFIDVIEPRPRLIIIGAGHVGWALAKLAAVVGFRLTIVDDNEDIASKDRYPMAEQVLIGEFAQVLDTLDVCAADYVVILHGEPEHDYLALEKTLKMKPAYVGLLGSRAKVGTLVKRLGDAGVGDADLKRLHAPVGLNINAKTPEEIGVSILAEIINERRRETDSS